MQAMCQRCGEERSSWTVYQAEITVGTLQHWKAMLCEPCSSSVARAVVEALRPVGKFAAPSAAEEQAAEEPVMSKSMEKRIAAMKKGSAAEEGR